jgi:ribosome-binding protein aMBF1 (putative translation factor)
MFVVANARTSSPQRGEMFEGWQWRAYLTCMHKKWMKEPRYRKAYEALEEEFVLASALIDARNRAGLTQEELARKTTQQVVARLESGRARPSMRTLERLANATGSALADQLRTALPSCSRPNSPRACRAPARELGQC